MIVRKKKSLLSRYLLPLILLVVFAALLVGAIVIGGIEKEEEATQTQTTTYDKLEGEGDNQRVLPTIVLSQISRVSVDNTGEKGKYSFMRSGASKEFYFFYDNGSGTEEVYLPPISVFDSNFSYSSLLATEAFGETSVSQIYNLGTAVGNIRFSERIELSADPAARAEQLKTYGLDEGSYSTVSVWFQQTQQSETEKFVLHIGAPVVTGVGYYLMVEGRDYIYATATDALESCMKDYTFYINARLVAEGLAEDMTYEPYLTTAFKHWKNTLVKEEGSAVTPSSKVVVHGLSHTTLPLGAESAEGAENGYIASNSADIAFPLETLSKTEYARLHDALVGQRIGDYSTSPILVTLPGSGAQVTLGDTYEYRITKVESALLDHGVELEVGTVPDATEIKVSYDVYIGGEKKNIAPMHAVIDISDRAENPIPESARTALRAATLGAALDTPVTFSITYTEANAKATNVKYYLERVIAIYDQNGREMEKVTENSIVSYRYYYTIDGVKTESQSMSVNMKGEVEGEYASIREKLIGLTTERLDNPILLTQDTTYEEAFVDFVAYEITAIRYFVERECIVSFAYQNASERNPFYGESLYENLTPGEYSLYALNAGACETVVNLLGGLGASSSTTVGLVGTKVLEVGLTPEIMEKYGLYAHTVYFELPRGILSLETEDENNDDYDWYETLGFTLYISDEVDGIRYVGSDMYDVVVEIDADTFVFCEYDFVELWARRQLVLVDVNEIEWVDIKFNMSDLSGSLRFDIEGVIHELTGGGTYRQMKINMTPSGGFTNAVIDAYLSRTGGTYIPLDAYYNYVLGGGKEITYGSDYAGAGYFKETLQMLYYTTYLGRLDESDKSKIDSMEPIMTMRFKVARDANPYAFEFYRIDDRRVGVRMYSEWSEGVAAGDRDTCDFYISTYAMKKIANGFLALSEARPVVIDSFGYGDKKDEE